MSYVNYDCQIVESHYVKLVGWTYKNFVSPQEILAVDDIRTLRNALRVGTCKWVRISKHEVNQHMKKYTEHLASGEITKKKWKARSDKGTKRKRNHNDSETSDESEGEGRKQKKSNKRKDKENKAPNGLADAAKKGGSKKGTKTASKAPGRSLKTQLPPAPTCSQSVISDSDFDDVDDPIPAFPRDMATAVNINERPDRTVSARASGQSLKTHLPPAPSCSRSLMSDSHFDDVDDPIPALPRDMATAGNIDKRADSTVSAVSNIHPPSPLRPLFTQFQVLTTAIPDAINSPGRRTPRLPMNNIQTPHIGSSTPTMHNRNTGWPGHSAASLPMRTLPNAPFLGSSTFSPSRTFHFSRYILCNNPIILCAPSWDLRHCTTFTFNSTRNFKHFTAVWFLLACKFNRHINATILFIPS